MFGLEAIWRNGQVVGHVRRADFGFTVNKTIAYGYIRDPSGGPVSEPRSPIPSQPLHQILSAMPVHAGNTGGSKPGRVEEFPGLVSSRVFLLVFSFISKRN